MPSPADLEFLRRFENCEVSEGEWTHKAHVQVAWTLAMTNPATSAERRLRAGILRHNTEVLGRPEKYHETVTLAFARIIRSRLRSDELWVDFLRRNQDLLTADEPILFAYYSPDRLFCEAARARFLEPDRAKLPQSVSIEWPGVNRV